MSSFKIKSFLRITAITICSTLSAVANKTNFEMNICQKNNKCIEETCTGFFMVGDNLNDKLGPLTLKVTRSQDPKNSVTWVGKEYNQMKSEWTSLIRSAYKIDDIYLDIKSCE